MSTIDLILLGALCQSPKSAYDLQKLIEQRNLSRWVKIGSYTVYKKVVLYEDKGYVTGEAVRTGKMPEKTLYTITPSGKKAFVDLMAKFSLAETRIFLDFNAVIVNLALVDDETAAAYIANIKDSIGTTKQQIAQQLAVSNERSLLGQSILEQQSMLLETLAAWETDFEKRFLERTDTNEYSNFYYPQSGNLSAVSSF